jgi:hypothetical protein
MSPYRLVIQVQVIWILRVGLVKCEISSYRAGFVEWDFSIGKHSARIIMGIMLPYALYVIPGDEYHRQLRLWNKYVQCCYR